jgi:hypothetical protein
MENAMTTQNQNDKPTDQRDAAAMRPGHEAFEAEVPAPQEPADFREPSEGGYGWGV